jgi:molecular chaperone DnaJ
VASADLYGILGVERTATPEDLKRAYRKLARELHPDANPGNAAAESRFKEVSQAYEILSDPERRAQYDRFGSENPFEGGFGFGAGSVQDIFDLFFGSMGGQSRHRGGPQPGPDAQLLVELTLEEAAFGVTRDVEVDLLVTCGSCSGSGAEPGTGVTRCAHCQGTGELRRVRSSFLGQVVTATPCANCRGAGEVIDSPCPECRGDGRLSSRRTLSIEIPAGIENGSTMRLNGRGPAGPRGGPAGTLFVHIGVAEDPRFTRVGDDLHHEAHIGITEATLGARIEVPTLGGTETIDVDPGSQFGDLVTLRHEGVHHLRGRGRGDLVVHLVVDVPRELDEGSEELLRQLAARWGHDVPEAHRGLFSRRRGAKR